MISKPRRKRLSIESASARPTCEGCKQSSSGPDGQENEAIQQLDGDCFVLGIYRKHWMKAHFSTGLCACWAWPKKAPELKPIFVINLLLGWTVFGWFVAIAWAPQWTRLAGKQRDDD